MDVELVHDDDEGEDEGRVHTRLHQHVEYALLYQNILQWCISYDLLNQANGIIILCQLTMINVSSRNWSAHERQILY